MPMSPMHCTIFEIEKQQKETFTHTHTHISHNLNDTIRYSLAIVVYVATSKSQYPRVVYNSKAMINHQSRFLFCFVLVLVLLFFGVEGDCLYF